MKNSDYLQVIKGDLTLSPGMAGGEFLMAKATDTRLMGVVGVHIKRNQDGIEYHQLFYLDFEEYGFDDYKSHLIKTEGDKLELIRDTNELFGGLGGKWHEITEKEAVYLIKSAAVLNQKYNEDYPDGDVEYLPILNAAIDMTETEQNAVLKKICLPSLSDYELVNYFIMRNVAMDMTGVDYLKANDMTFELIPMTVPGTLCKNDIVPKDEDFNPLASTREYVSTSLIDEDDRFRLILSEIAVTGPKVTGFRVISDMKISVWEASLIIRQQEYSTLYQIKRSSDSGSITLIRNALRMIFLTSTESLHRDGKLYMVFRDNNKHVDSPNYRLDHDTVAAIYSGGDGEIVVAGYDLNNLRKVEIILEEIANKTGIPLVAIGRYVFPEATLGGFLADEYGQFANYLDFIQYFRDKE